MRIMYVDIDTLNASHLSCYGYHRKTTPNIDSVADDGVRFEECYTSDAPCLPSRAALVSGMFGIHSGCVGHGHTAAEKRIETMKRGFRNPDDLNNLFYIFRKKNMETVSFSTFAERHSAWWFNSGFKELHNFGKTGMESGEEILPKAQKWLSEFGKNDNWFMHFQIWDPHTPIRVPEWFGDPFKDEPIDEWFTQDILDKHKKSTGAYSIQEISGKMVDEPFSQYPRQKVCARTMDELKEVVDSYDCGVAYADYIVGELFKQLKELGIYEDTAIIISSDHGENIGELGIYQEHGTADYHTCRLPMIFKYPGGVSGIVAKNFYYNVDLAPTLASLLDVKAYEKWDGKSYANLILTGEEDFKRDNVVISQMAHVCQRSVRFGDYLYMRTYHDGFRLFPDEMLFNIKEDMHEQYNLANEETQVLETARGILEKWHDEMMNTSCFEEDPMQTVLKEGGPLHAPIDRLPSYMERLKKTGREEQANELAKKYNIDQIPFSE